MKKRRMGKTDRLQVTYMLEDISAMGGVQKHVIDSCHFLAERGIRVRIYSRFLSDPKFNLQGVELETLYPVAYLELKRQADGSASNDTLSEKLLAFESEAKEKLNQFAAGLNESDVLIVPQYGMLWELDRIGWLEAKRRFRVFGAYHSSFAYAKAQKYFNLLCGLLKKADVAIFLTEGDRADFAAMGIKNTVAIPNAIADPGDEIDAIVRGRDCVYLGRLDAEKGVVELVTNWIRESQVDSHFPKLHIFGDGDQYGRIKALIEHAKAENDIFLEGRTSEPLKALAAARMVVSCSPREGFPMTLLEGCSVGTPAVVYNAGPGTHQLVEGHGAGVVVDCGDSVAFGRAVKTLQTDETLWSECSRKAIGAASHFTPKVVYDNWVALLEETQGRAEVESKEKVSFKYFPSAHESLESFLALVKLGSVSAKSFVLIVKAFGHDGRDISREVLGLPYSQELGAHYINSPAITADDDPVMRFPLSIKPDVEYLELEFLRWGLKSYAPGNKIRRIYSETMIDGIRIINCIQNIETER
ncbi:glycosyltransferase [Corynebacterium glucuronolyticum]|nr:glycosyltransferase [Corynebacterium glucuronolyticum]